MLETLPGEWMRARRLTCIFLFAVLFATARPARAQQTFAAGSLIIPMDVDYQNAGMFKAVGLLYQLLKAGVPVEWCIATGKTLYTGNTAFPTNAASAIDFTASATDTRTNAVITNHGYRGGPFVIDSSYRTQALPIITAWTTKYPQVAVHSATASFTATVSRNLINAPNIAINADGHEDIAFGYLNAAAIPDSKGQAWPTGTANSYPGYPDIMTPAQIAGPTTTNHHDGSLFDKNGLPVYCQVMSMHWDVGKRNEETIAEMASFFKYPTHLFAECQAVNCIEDATAGHFVSSDNLSGEPQSSVGCFNVPDNGLCAAQQPNQVSLFQSDLPFAQFDGAFATVGGSEPGYGLAPGSNYYNVGIVMMRSATASGFGQDDLWMTGVAGGLCAIGDHGNNCAGYGKVSYLGGHQYSTNLPMLQNPQSQGTRLFLQSLFEAGCTTLEGQPNLTITKSGPSTTYSALVTYDVNWNVAGPGAALNVIVTDTLPANATFVSASAPGVFANGKVTWALGDLAPRTSGQLTVTVSLPAHGAYTDVAGGVYSIGNSTDAVPGSSVTTVYQEAPDFAVPPDLAGSLCTNAMCTPPTNPCQTIACDPQTGACVTSNIADGTGCTTGDACVVGQSCTGGVCGGGVAVQCPTPTSACQTIACDHARGCVTTNVADGSACSSG